MKTYSIGTEVRLVGYGELNDYRIVAISEDEALLIHTISYMAHSFRTMKYDGFNVSKEELLKSIGRNYKVIK